MEDAELKEHESRRVIDAGRERGIYLRVVGGLAIKLHCPSATHRGLSRGYADIDYVGYAKQSIPIKRLFEDLGYFPHRRFNAMQGRTRLIFAHPDKQIDVDIFLDIFQMCHKLSFSNRLHLDDYTIPLSDLLLTKLQVVQLNEKDVKDIYSILYDHEVAYSVDKEVIDAGRIVDICADDWGWYKTVMMTLDKCLGMTDKYLSGEEHGKVEARIEQLKQDIEAAPKTVRWKLREAVGEKVRWYDLPEEVAAVKAEMKETAAGQSGAS